MPYHMTHHMEYHMTHHMEYHMEYHRNLGPKHIIKFHYDEIHIIVLSSSCFLSHTCSLTSCSMPCILLSASDSSSVPRNCSSDSRSSKSFTIPFTISNARGFKATAWSFHVTHVNKYCLLTFSSFPNSSPFCRWSSSSASRRARRDSASLSAWDTVDERVLH